MMHVVTFTILLQRVYYHFSLLKDMINLQILKFSNINSTGKISLQCKIMLRLILSAENLKQQEA